MGSYLRQHEPNGACYTIELAGSIAQEGNFFTLYTNFDQISPGGPAQCAQLVGPISLRHVAASSEIG